MSSLKLDRHLETKAKDELQEDLIAEQKRQKVWLILTIVTAVLLVVAIVLMVFTSLNNPLIGIIAFALFIGQRYCGRSLEQMRSFGFPVLVLVPILFFYTVSLIGSSSPRGKDRTPKLQDKPEEGAGNTNNIDIQ